MTSETLDKKTGQRRPVQSSATGTSGHKGSLRSKLVLSLAAIFAIFLIVDEVARRTVIQPVFAGLERAAAIRDANRVIAAIGLKSHHLRDVVEQSAAKISPEELTAIAKSQSEDQSESQSGDADQAKAADQTKAVEAKPYVISAQWAAIVGSDGSWQWIHQGGQKDIAKDRCVDPELFDSLIVSLRHVGTKSINGLIKLRNRETLFAYAAAPIESKDQSVMFYLVAGNALDTKSINEIRHRTQVDFSIQIYRREKNDQRSTIWEADEHNLVVETPLSGISGKNIANLFVQVPRDVVRQSQQTIAVARNLFVCGVTAALLLLLLQLQRLVMGPLMAIREHTEKITEHGLDAGALTLGSNDEIGALANAFDRMRDHLSDTQSRLADASHAAGMSQVADTVIHNVGNVLTNVNSLIETATDRVNGLRVSPLEKLAGRLQEASPDDPLCAATPDYLKGLAATLSSDKTELAELLKTLAHNVTHIHDVIRDQSRHTMNQVEKSRFSLTSIINEAFGCCRARLEQDQIEVELPLQTDVDVESDRSLLLQIVINIFSNARHAIRESGCPNPKLSISLEHAERSVRLSIRDNGCGMNPETLGRVFEAHFTTRKTGSGLGLHFCAIALKRLGGSIDVYSDGLGLGSIFVIELPIATVRSMQPLSLAVTAHTATQMNEPTR